MNKEHLKYLVCPRCQISLKLKNIENEAEHIISGKLICIGCRKEFPVKEGIPRFIEENYSESFGLEWNIHSKTQYDDYSGQPITLNRFEEETKWEKNLDGQIIIEPGCGSGRFTQHAVKTNAMVLSFDSSSAVTANYNSNKKYKNLLIVQASIYEMPFKDNLADKLFCFGVLQHTPDPEMSFHFLSNKIKDGGLIAADIYAFKFLTLFKTKYWVRPITRKIKKEKLYRLCRYYINLMWPIAKFNMRIFPKKIAKKINWQLLIPDYSYYRLDQNMLKEWAYLDIFDMLSPTYDKPKSLKTFRKWFEKYGFSEIDVHYGYNGVEGRGKKIKS